MKEQYPVNLKPTKRRWIGYFSDAFRNFITGSDTGYTLVKAGIVLVLGITAAGVFAIPIIVAGAVVGILYVASSFKAEYDRVQAEDRKINEELIPSRHLKKNVKRFLNNKLKVDGQEEAALNIAGLDNQRLLKVLVHNYFSRLNLLNCDQAEFEDKLSRMRKANGHLPSQQEIIRLIESVTGFSRNDPEFAAKISAFLQSDLRKKPEDFDLKFTPEFTAQLCQAFNLTRPDEDEVEANIQPELKKKGILRNILTRLFRFGKNSLLFVAKGNTAFALVVGSAALLGFITTGAAVFWPILLVGGVLAILSGTASLVYSRYVEKSYKQNLKNIDAQTKYNQTRYLMLHRLNKLSNKEYTYLDEYTESYNDYAESYNYGESRFIDSLTHRREIISTSFKARTATSIVAQVGYGVSAGFLVGASVAAVVLIVAGFILPPLGISIAGLALTLTLAGAIAGGIYGLRYGYMMGKNSNKSRAAEKAAILRTTQLRDNYEETLDHDMVEKQLPKSQRELVADLLRSYISRVQTKTKQSYSEIMAQQNQDQEVIGSSPETHPLLDKKEKFLQVLEKATGIKRSFDADTHMRNNGDEKFYEALSYYLQEDKKTRVEANQLVSQFKSIITGNDESPLNVKGPSWMPSWKKVSSVMTFGNQLSWKHIVPVLGLLGVAIPVGFVLFGPAAFIPLGIIAGVVTTFFVVNKVCEVMAERNLKKLAEIEAKLPVIEAISKNTKNTPQVRSEIRQDNADLVPIFSSEEASVAPLPQHVEPQRVETAAKPNNTSRQFPDRMVTGRSASMRFDKRGEEEERPLIVKCPSLVGF